MANEIDDVSILTSVKSALGIEEDATDFDSDILIYINSALGTLSQLNVGPSIAFVISDAEPTWFDFMGNTPNIASVKSYVIQQAKLDFDPPPTSFGIEAAQNRVKELGWRLNIEMEQQKHPEGSN